MESQKSVAWTFQEDAILRRIWSNRTHESLTAMITAIASALGRSRKGVLYRLEVLKLHFPASVRAYLREEEATHAAAPCSKPRRGQGPG